MPTINRTTSGIGTVSAASLQALINTLTSAMITNNGVTANDVNQLIGAYNTWRQHTHSSTDLRGQDTFGNVTLYGGAGMYAGTKTTSAAKDTGGTTFPNEPFLNAVNDQIDDTDVNTIIARINNIRNHKHTINDSTS